MLAKNSLRFLLLEITVLMVLTMSAVILIVISYLYQVRIFNEYVSQGKAVSQLAASLLSGETVDRYLDSRTEDADYRQTLDLLRTMQQDYKVKYIYVFKPVEGGSVFIFDTDAKHGLGLGDFANWHEDVDEGYRDHFPALERGERIEPVVVKSQKWGHLLSSFEPILRADGSVAAYAGADFSMDTFFRERNNALIALGVAVPLLVFIFSSIHYFAVNRIVISPVRELLAEVSAYMKNSVGNGEAGPETPPPSGNELDVLKFAITEMQSRIDKAMLGLRKAEERSRLMLDSIPLACHLWGADYKIIDCNEASVKLFELKNKKEYLASYDHWPEFQPNGRPSRDMVIYHVKKAFKEGRHAFDWMNQTSKGEPLPSEVTLVRVAHKDADVKDAYVVVAYIRDMRHIKNMERNIHRLEMEVDKIFHDPLTGIYNRRFFDENLDRAIKSLSRPGNTLSLLMVDIDHFKNYNDRYGHIQGDFCLKKVATALCQGVTRVNDFVARYGGEEFAVVLPDTGAHGACVVAEKLLENVRDCNIPHEDNEAADRVTVSIGVTTGIVEKTQNPIDYITRADEMLYKSKQEGRNRFSFKSL
jgi:diguanylate cyclase (GGDEF)-like protein